MNRTIIAGVSGQKTRKLIYWKVFNFQVNHHNKILITWVVTYFVYNFILPLQMSRIDKNVLVYVYSSCFKILSYVFSFNNKNHSNSNLKKLEKIKTIQQKYLTVKNFIIKFFNYFFNYIKWNYANDKFLCKNGCISYPTLQCSNSKRSYSSVKKKTSSGTTQ